MKKILWLALITIVSAIQLQAQTKLGYYKEGQASLIYTNFKQNMDDADADDSKISGLGLDIRVNYSLLGNLIFRDPEKKFFIGDHLGAGFGMGYFKKPGDDFPFMLSLNLEFGVKSTYIINDDIEVGLKYIVGAANYFTDLKNDFGLVQKPAIIPAVRFKNIMGQVGFGKGTTGDGSSGSYFMAEGRLIFGEMNDEQKGSLFLRLENYNTKWDTDRKDNAAQISVGFALM